MTTYSGQAANEDPIDPVLEALLKELTETGSHPNAGSRTEDTISSALSEALMRALAHTVSEASPFDRALLVVALAPILAEALAPVLAEALAPALVRALSNMAAPKKTSQESASSEGSD
jgi:hypothetical protein